MSLLRNILNSFDRPGGRWLLAAASSAYARLRGNNLTIHHDGNFWLFSSQGMTLPRSAKFDFYDFDLRTLAGRIAHYSNETEDCWFYLYKPKLGDIIVDVGAEIGTDTIIFSRAVGQEGRVIAIEAQPHTYDLLLRTCRANRLENVQTLNVAVADKAGDLRISSDEGVESNFLGEAGELVKADSLDHLLKDVPRIDFLKMNIEGAERLAIQAMDRTVEKTSRLAIACHDFIDTTADWFRTLDKVSAYLRSKGFTVIRRDADDREYVRYHLHAFREETLPATD